jgi:hypothetical protein
MRADIFHLTGSTQVVDHGSCEGLVFCRDLLRCPKLRFGGSHARRGGIFFVGQAGKLELL